MEGRRDISSLEKSRVDFFEKDRQNLLQRCGVPGLDDPKARTSFKPQFKEHLTKNTATQWSNYPEHLIQFRHNYCNINQNLQIIHKCKKSSLVSKLENYEIYEVVKSDPDNVLTDKINSQAKLLHDAVINLERMC
ncbi:hypothetical protein J6590_037228 [Homalodisca vitripennis]|nr:hypothetical protein J6590_037228 [Homalodisca vitripennis]